MSRWDVHFNMLVADSGSEIQRLVSKTHALAGVIGGIPIPPGAQHKIDALNILRAVRGTTGIEGSELTDDEVQRIMEARSSRPVLGDSRRREEQEARNAEELMQYVASRLLQNADLPLTEELICKFHAIVTKDIEYPNNTPGKYRSHPVSAQTSLPPESGVEVRRLMREFVAWLNGDAPLRWDPVIRAIVAHFYVVSIHPFGDGNGRVARGAESFLLFQAGVNARGFYSLANFYYRNRSDYIRLLDHVRFETDGDMTPFVLFALRGLVEELEAVHADVLGQVLLISFRDFAREVLTNHGKLGTKPGERMFHFLLDLSGPVSLKDLRSGKHPLSHYYHGVTKKTLARDVNFLKEHKLIILDGDELRANYEIMTRFMPPAELLNPEPPRKPRR